MIHAARELSYRTSAQVALEDRIFHELFGMIWNNGGYQINSTEDLSWAILYKDVFLQATSDYANEGFVKVARGRYDLMYGNIHEWVNDSSPFNDPEQVEELQEKLDTVRTEFEAGNPSNTKRAIFERKIEKVQVRLRSKDPFSFDMCCDTLGLDVEEARARFNFYRTLKKKHGHDIRIVAYTSKKNVNIPSLQDIIDVEEANGEHDPALFLHFGVKRDLRNQALARRKNERFSKGSPR